MKISLEKAKKEKLFYFVVTGIIYHPKLKKCLILKRSEKEVAHPGLWGVTGGKLEHKDMLENKPTKKNHDIWDWDNMVDKLVAREAKEESGLMVGDIRYIDNVVFLRPDNVPVVLIKFGAKYIQGRVKIAAEFDDYAWVNEKEVKEYRIIQGIDREIAQTIKIYSAK